MEFIWGVRKHEVLQSSETVGEGSRSRYRYGTMTADSAVIRGDDEVPQEKAHGQMADDVERQLE